MRAFYLIPGFVCLFIGGIFLLICRWSRIKQETADVNLTGRTWARLTGTGERMEWDYNNRSHIVYYGVYEYDTADGQHISSASEFNYHDLKSIPGAQGRMVSIRYDPENPAAFDLEEEQDITRSALPKYRKIGIRMMILGGLLAIAAVAAMLGAFDKLIAGILG